MLKAVTLFTVILYKKPSGSRGRARRALTKRGFVKNVYLVPIFVKSVNLVKKMSMVDELTIIQTKNKTQVIEVHRIGMTDTDTSINLGQQ